MSIYDFPRNPKVACNGQSRVTSRDRAPRSGLHSPADAPDGRDWQSTDSLSTKIAAIALIESGDGQSLFLSLVRSGSNPAQVDRPGGVREM
jgi:hypothetical protein